MNTPQWLDSGRIKISFDARPLLAEGIHPLERVQQECATLGPGEIYEIITPFPPFPMIQKMEDLGFDSFSEQKGNVFYTYFRKC